MKRRDFVLKSIKAIPIAVFAPSLLTACSRDEDIDPGTKTVVVIGAGISGLTAASTLKTKGFNIIVLESQDKVGGRLRTDRSLGIPFDEGASWIHGPNGNPITALALASGTKTFLTEDENVKVYNQDGTIYSDAYLDEQYSEFENAVKQVLANGNKDQSFETIFTNLYPTKGNDNLWKYMLSAYLEFDTGADISKLTSKYFDDDEVYPGKDVIVTNGYDTITNQLSKGLDIRLNSTVTKVDYSNTRPIISYNGIDLTADYVIVSVPLGVLKKGTIKFHPELPMNKKNAIENTNMGNVNKFLLVWDTPFWETELQYIGYTGGEKGKYNYFLNLNTFAPDANALMTFAFGDEATISEGKSDVVIQEEIMSHLRTIYGNTIPNAKHFLRTKWGQNPHSFGAYSYATNGTTTQDFDHMELEIMDRLFFAGEHTEFDYRGTVHGAYLSGIREANKIIELL